MRITRRDIAIVRDIALSHVMSRDQLIGLGYFNSITRANTRVRELISAGLVSRLGTPFFQQSLYTATKAAAEVVGERIALLIEGRTSSPRYIQHALQVTDVRLALAKRSDAPWRFEQQLWRKLDNTGGKEVRPDGALITDTPLFIEVDMGHAGLPRIKEKLASYRALSASGSCGDLYGFSEFRLLIVTTGPLRARHFRGAVSSDIGFECLIQTFKELGVAQINPWS